MQLRSAESFLINLSIMSTVVYSCQKLISPASNNSFTCLVPVLPAQCTVPKVKFSECRLMNMDEEECPEFVWAGTSFEYRCRHEDHKRHSFLDGYLTCGENGHLIGEPPKCRGNEKVRLRLFIYATTSFTALKLSRSLGA